MQFSMPSAVLGATLGTLVLATALFLLARMPGAARGLRLFALASAVNAVRFLVLLGQPLAGLPVVVFLSESLHVLASILLVGGTAAFLGRRFPWPLGAGVAVLTVGWVGFASWAYEDFFLLSLPVSVLASASMMGAAWAFLRQWRRDGDGGYLFVAGVLAVWGLHKLDYPWLAGYDWFAPLGFMLSEGLSMILAVALIVLALHRVRAEAALVAASRRHFLALMDNLADGVVAVGPDGRVRAVNKAAERIFGWRAEDLLGRPASTVLPDPERPGHAAGICDGPVTVAGRGLEVAARHKDGRLLPADLMLSDLPVEGQSLRVVMVRDLSGRRLNDAFEAMVNEMNQRVLQAQNIETILQFLCDRLVLLYGFPLVWIATRERDGSLTLMAQAGEDAEPGEETRPGDDPNLGPAAEAVRQEQTVVAATDSPRFATALEEARSRGYAVTAALPLQAHRRVVGVLSVFARDTLEPNQMRRLEALSMRLGIALQIALDQRRLRLQGAAMAAAANAIFITDDEGRIEWVNRAFTRLSGYPADEAVGQTPRILKSGVQSGEDYEEFWRTIRAGSVWRGEMVERRKDGSYYTVDQTVTPMRDPDGRIAHYVVVHEDITERKRAEERIRYLSHYDSLTALPNRLLFRDRLQQAVARARAGKGKLAVLFIDLENFSRINDTLGHDYGDRLLTVIVDRITDVARSADTIARVGGDEFAVVQTDLTHAESVAVLAQKIIQAICRPVDLDGHDAQVSAGIGISIFPDDAEDPEQLVKNADMAMYRAVREMPQSFQFFSQEMNTETQARLDMERDLRRALGRQELLLHYQPQVDALTGRITSMEALVRWRHPKAGMISPGRFIPIAEDSGLIVPLGDWTLREACRQLRAWLDEGLPVVRVGVNFSALQLRQPDPVGMVHQILEETWVPPQLVELELTESAVMTDAEEAAKLLNDFSELGIQLAIDDFGTGYSSLSYLKRFPVDKLKIDQSFVRELPRNQNDAGIARAIISLGHTLGLKVVSEGVETAEQCRYLEDAGCDLFQGYFFTQPIPAPEAMRLLREQPFERH
ncbi:EAL domain-containing protein [Telmatospirillum sp. J64-1]|uniref:EAL domain-containing protein n=1 Tax=Telmatospirillum sp. J64-1 TaxID=2502183 RepID=UPI00115D0C85|nr:EAL domain-containing protein [Telmatospirillum sp. J64-1]